MRDRPGTVARRLIRWVDRYRSGVRHRPPQGQCKFTPTCSAYALEALHTRAVTVAILMIVWRLLRCNPLTRHHHHDPVVRLRKQRPRANSMRTASVLLLGGVLGISVASAAFGQSISSGCSGTVNGRSPQSLTADSPIVVGKGESITVSGQGPSKAGGSVNGNYSIAIVEGLFKLDKRNQNWGGSGQSFQGSINVDDYLKYGSGLYKVEGVATAASGWKCSASFYVRLDGSKIIGIVGGGIGLLGGLGVVRSARRKPTFQEAAPAATMTGEVPAARPTGETAEGISEGFGKEFIGLTEDEMTTKPPVTQIDRLANSAVNVGGCAALLIAEAFGDSMALLFPIAMTMPDGGKRLWVKGKPVLGFISGLVAGLGATVALQQFGYWALTIPTAIGFPIFTAIVGAARAWRGTAYKVG